MDPSALIFLALAVAWAAYLIPKALEHHDESLRSRTISTFSHTIRVLARREATDGRTARLVKGAGASAAAVVPAAVTVRRRASAAARRRIVLLTLVVANFAVAGIAWYGVAAWYWQAAPAGLLIAWLVACRLMVRREGSRRGAPLRQSAPVGTDQAGSAADGRADAVAPAEDDTTNLPAVTGSWDPVDVPLPTYVSKPAAARSVRTIDLDSTGVWSSGRSAADSALAREADVARRTSRERETPRRATGS